MLLKPGMRAAFRCFNGKIITGKVVAVMYNHYLVIGDDVICNQHDDTLFRFTDSNVLGDGRDKVNNR